MLQQCVEHLYGFSRSKTQHCKQILLTQSGHLREESDIIIAQNRPHGLRGHPSNRISHSLNLTALMTAWLTTNLTGLIDFSPSKNKQYLPCYIRPKDMHQDCRLELHVCLFIYFI